MPLGAPQVLSERRSGPYLYKPDSDSCAVPDGRVLQPPDERPLGGCGCRGGKVFSYRWLSAPLQLSVHELDIRPIFCRPPNCAATGKVRPIAIPHHSFPYSQMAE